MGAKYFGAAVLRREDPRFLRGEGRFVDDVTLPGLLQAAFLRSPHAHARIVAIRTERAKKMPGVVAVFSHAIGDAGRALAGADVVLEETFRIQRYVGMPLEGRGVVAAWDRRDGTLTTWNSTQVSHFVQQGLVTALELLPHRIRVIAPDLGGGFGTKASGYPEDALIPIAARVLGRPVKWIEDRREHMMGAAHARHQPHTIRLGARRDGTPLVYGSGDFPAALASALTAAEYDRVRKEQESLRARGVWRGIGISGYVEGTAIGPFEGARVTLDAAGRVRVATGAVCSGQGHETSFAQVAADALGVPLDWVTVTGGDTAGVPFGVGTFARRSGVTAGNSIVDAARP